MNRSKTLSAIGIVLPILLVLGCSADAGRGSGRGTGTDIDPVFGDDGGVDTDGSTPGNGGGGGGNGGGGMSEPEACEKMDILFVIDDSGSMAEEQENLAMNFPGFIDVLNEYRAENGNPLDYRVAVTTTGVTFTANQDLLGIPLPQNFEGDDGAMRQECGMSRPWVERSDTDVASTFGCAATVGIEGSAEEMPMRALTLALTDRVSDGTNAGFMREDALLAVVMLTDEDDCSTNEREIDIMTGGIPSPGATSCVADGHLTTPNETILALDQVKGDRGRWAATVIAGPDSCTSDFGMAAEATRLKDFVRQAGDNAVFSSICEGDLTISLRDALDTFQAACESFPPLI